MLKQIAIVAIAVVVGMWLYGKLKATTKTMGAKPISEGLTFSASDLDPVTGAQLPRSAQPGTVEFAAQGN